MLIKAITLYQPWATLAGLRYKEIETRSWYTSYRGPLAIHAAQKYTYGIMGEFWDESPIWRNALINIGVDYDTGFERAPLPHGSVVAIGNLVDCLKIEEDGLYTVLPASPNVDVLVLKAPLPEEPERSFGDYTPGRFAWILNDVRPLNTPIPAKGRQRLWKWDMPNNLQFIA